MARGGTSIKALTELLANVPLFGGCSKKELQAIARSGKLVEHGSGHVICREGDAGHGLHLVIEGETKVQIGGRTRRRLGPGAFFGEIALLDRGARTATVIADSPVTTFVLPTWNFRSLIKAQPELALKMLEEVAGRLRSSDASFSD